MPGWKPSFGLPTIARARGVNMSSNEFVSCPGVVGDNALGFLAGLGIASVLEGSSDVRRAAVSWSRGGWEARFVGVDSVEQVAREIERDRLAWEESPVLSFNYPKVEKNGVKAFKGLRAPIGIWRHWLEQTVDSGQRHVMDYAAVLANEVSVEEVPAAKRVSVDDMCRYGVPQHLALGVAVSTMPTFFDFTSRNAQFLDQVSILRSALDEDSILSALSGRDDWTSAGRTLGWDGSVDQPAALYSYGRPTNPVLEWLAFRGLEFFPVAGSSNRLAVTSCRGRRKNGVFCWPLWDGACRVSVVKALLKSDWASIDAPSRRARGVVQVFEAGLTKAADGYSGIFSPSRPA